MCHPDRVRSAPLPTGYQFGDGVPICSCEHTFCSARYRYPRSGRGQTIRVIPPLHWRAPHENAAERIARYQTEYEVGRDCGDEASA